MKRLALIVERDDHGCVKLPVGGFLLLPRFGNFVIGRASQCDLVVNVASVNRRNCGIEHTPDGWVLTDYGGTNGVWINRTRVNKQHVIQPGDRIYYDDVCLRFDLVDAPLLQRVVKLDGGWVGYDVNAANGGSVRAFSLDGGAVRHGWVAASPADDPLARAVASLAGARPGFPQVVHAWEGGGLIHRAFLLEGGVPFSRLLRDGPRWHLSARTGGIAPPEIASRLLLECARLMSVTRDMAGVDLSADDLLITWSGRLSCRLSSRRSPGGSLEDAAHALAPGLPPFQPRPRPHPWTPISRDASFDEVEAAIRDHSREVPPADEPAVAATLAALFPEEHDAFMGLMEELGCLDEEGLEALLLSSSPLRMDDGPGAR